MILIRAIYFLLVLFFAAFSMSYTFADTHDTNASAEVSEEEALPLNDPFAGDESLSSGRNKFNFWKRRRAWSNEFI